MIHDPARKVDEVEAYRFSFVWRPMTAKNELFMAALRLWGQNHDGPPARYPRTYPKGASTAGLPSYRMASSICRTV